ncbi:UNVERIFIED_CONTAM: glutamine--fructose-6-phosphate aminotransferase, partial [Salmonella enterica subsp. enterica serovar Weltevreden]
KNYRECGDLTDAMRVTAQQLEGAFTLLAVHADLPGTVVAARRNSPLVIGLGEGENFLGSDVAAFVEYTHHAMEIGQDQLVTIRPD